MSNGSVFDELTFTQDLNAHPYFRGIAGRDVWDHITISAVELQFRLSFLLDLEHRSIFH